MSLGESFSLLDELPEPPDDDDEEEDDEVLAYAAPAAVALPNLVSITWFNNALSLHKCTCKQRSERNAVKRN
jgi:hypothetical protein